MAIRRLICLPWAGGGPSGYRVWSRFLPPQLELWGISLAGHEGRMDEEPSAELDKVAAEVGQAIMHHQSLPFVLYGHSFGAWLAFEVARLLQDEGRGPTALVVSGRSSPAHWQGPDELISGLPDKEFVHEVCRRYGGLPGEAAKDEEVLNAVLPALRADLAMLEAYAYEPGQPLECPLHILAGKDDPATARKGALDGWCGETASLCRVQYFDGGHFFLTERAEEVTEYLSSLPSPTAPPSPGREGRRRLPGSR